MKSRLSPHFIKALDTQVSLLPSQQDFQLILKKSPLRPDNLRQCVHEMVLSFSQEFEVHFPALNSTLLLFKHMKDLALPRKHIFLSGRMCRD